MAGGPLFLSWGRNVGRAEEIADALGGTARAIWFPRLASRRLILLRYAASAVASMWVLARRRPDQVIVSNPPIVPGILVALYALRPGVRFVLDSHPASFGVKENRVAAAVLPIHRWLVRRADGVLVTSDEWVRLVEQWGGSGLVVHEAPRRGVELVPPRSHERPKVVFVAVFAPDEPVAAVVDAARELPGVDIAITGALERAPVGLVEGSPANVHYVGYLPQADYLDLLRDSDIVLTLSTEPTSVMRSAYEAVYLGRHLIVSDWPVLHDVFPHATHCDNAPGAIAEAIRAAVRAPADATARRDALALQERRWEEQRGALQQMLT